MGEWLFYAVSTKERTIADERASILELALLESFTTLFILGVAHGLMASVLLDIVGMILRSVLA